MDLFDLLFEVGDPVVAFGLCSFVLLLIALPFSFWSVSASSSSSNVKVLVALANLALTAQLVLRWWQSGHFPVSNLYESLCFLAWASTLTQLLVERSLQSPFVSAVSTPLALKPSK